MSIRHSPTIVIDGLELNLDATNRKNYNGNKSLLSIAGWTAGVNSCTGFAAIDSSGPESARSLQSDPWGRSSIIWGTFPSGDGGADGGWNSDQVPIDSTKIYRQSVWVKRTAASTGGGTFYFGLYTNGSGQVYDNSNSLQTNPYWDYRGVGWFTPDVW